MATRQIWKFPVHLTDRVHISIPDGAHALSVQVQHGQVQMWALVDPDAPLVLRAYRVVGTGHPFDPTGWRFVGTFQVESGALVFHLFEGVEP